MARILVFSNPFSSWPLNSKFLDKEKPPKTSSRSTRRPRLSGKSLKPPFINPCCTFSCVEKNKLSTRIGFLGLGIMGSPMAHNLIKAGCDVTVWNRTTSKCESLLNIGAKYGSSPENVASTCDITFSMLAEPGSAMEVACGKQGVVHGLGPGKGYVDVSTVDGGTSKAISIAIKATGAQFLEAPVSGSKKPAEEGKLIFLAAGTTYSRTTYICDKLFYDEVAPLLDIMGKSRFYLGDVGNGAAMKLIVNMMMGSGDHDMVVSFCWNSIMEESEGKLKGIFGYTDDYVVSTYFIGDNWSKLVKLSLFQQDGGMRSTKVWAS